ncbi:MAG: hypothetical protein IKL40_06215 [Clostridia bacterium]|nr:hypothetical protein [Clostridia bacterium]
MHDVEALQQKIDKLCCEKEIMYQEKKKIEDDLKLALDETERLRQEIQFLKGQVSAFQFCASH